MWVEQRKMWKFRSKIKIDWCIKYYSESVSRHLIAHSDQRWLLLTKNSEWKVNFNRHHINRQRRHDFSCSLHWFLFIHYFRNQNSSRQLLMSRWNISFWIWWVKCLREILKAWRNELVCYLLIDHIKCEACHVSIH